MIDVTVDREREKEREGGGEQVSEGEQEMREDLERRYNRDVEFTELIEIYSREQ